MTCNVGDTERVYTGGGGRGQALLLIKQILPHGKLCRRAPPFAHRSRTQERRKQTAPQPQSKYIGIRARAKITHTHTPTESVFTEHVCSKQRHKDARVNAQLTTYPLPRRQLCCGCSQTEWWACGGQSQPSPAESGRTSGRPIFWRQLKLCRETFLRLTDRSSCRW